MYIMPTYICSFKCNCFKCNKNHLVKRSSMFPYSFFLKRFSSPLEQHKVSESYDKDEF